VGAGWTILISLHAAGATLAVLLGGWLVARQRKGDLLHRRIGRIWMVDMYWVTFSSFGIQRLNPATSRGSIFCRSGRSRP
jgi:uncharacterized membrane protein